MSDSDFVKQVDAMAVDVAYIRRTLEGDALSPGLLDLVKRNTQDIDIYKAAMESSERSKSTLPILFFGFMIIAVIVAIVDRGLLISDIRHMTPLSGGEAWAVSVVLGLIGKAAISAPMAVIVFWVASR